MKKTLNGYKLADLIHSRFNLNVDVGVCSLIARHTKTHHRCAVDACNGHPIHWHPDLTRLLQSMSNEQIDKMQRDHEEWTEKGSAQAEKRITELAKEYLGLGVEFQGDPRGCTVVLKYGQTNRGRFHDLPISPYSLEAHK